MIINIRGTSGSGKTYAVMAAMKYMDPLAVMPPIPYTETNGKERTAIMNFTHYKLQPIYFIGDYTKAASGGTDTIRNMSVISSLIRHFSRFGHVIYEGLFISKGWSRHVALYEELTAFNEQFVSCFLDTPIEVCIERVLQRRAEKGNTKPFNEKNTRELFDAVIRRQKQMIDAGYWVEVLNHTQNTGEAILELLKQDDRAFSESYREESFK